MVEIHRVYRFENILQSPEYSQQFNNFISKDIECSQNAVDSATQDLTNLLITAALQADTCPKLKMINNASVTAGSRRINRKRVAHPKWHDTSCYEAHRKIVTTAKILKLQPKNPYLLGKLRTETKDYNRLIKSKHKQFVDNMFERLDSMQHNDPRGYMQLVKSMRDGNFDKQVPDDTSGVSAADWYTHFSDLLAKPIDQLKKDFSDQFILKNADLFKTKLD